MEKPFWKRALNKAQDFVAEDNTKLWTDRGAKLLSVAAQVGQAQLTGPLGIAGTAIGVLQSLQTGHKTGLSRSTQTENAIRKKYVEIDITKVAPKTFNLLKLLRDNNWFADAESFPLIEDSGDADNTWRGLVKTLANSKKVFVTVRDAGEHDGDDLGLTLCNTSSRLEEGTTDADLINALWSVLGTNSLCFIESGDRLNISAVTDYEDNDYIGPNDPKKFIEKYRRHQEAGISRAYQLIGPPGTGKCLGVGTPVMLYDGRVVLVENIVEGDLLMGPDSKPRKVLNTNVGRGPLCRINPVKGDSWVCNDVHVMTVKNTDTKKITDIPLNDFRKRSKWFQQRSKLFRVGVEFPVREPPSIDPYFLGVWFGDGTKEIGPRGLTTVAVTKPDVEIKECCEQIAAIHGCYVKTFGKSDNPTHGIYAGPRGKVVSNPLLDKLRDLLGANLIIPDSIRYGSREVRLSFLAGFIDTDGHLCCSYELTQRREDWALAVRDISRSVGLAAYMTPKPVDGTMYHRVNISGHLDIIPTRILRKRSPARKQIKDVLVTGLEIDDIGEGDYYGFTLDGDGRFLLGDYTVTHNTTYIFECVSYLGKEGKDGKVVLVTPSILNNISDKSVISELIVAFQPDIVAFEDVDHVNDGGELLFMIDGIRKELPGTLVFATANNPKDIPEALKRPSRFGRAVNFPAPDLALRVELIQLYSAKIGLNRDITGLAAYMKHDRFSHDHIKDVCMQALVDTDDELKEHIEFTIENFADYTGYSETRHRNNYSKSRTGSVSKSKSDEAPMPDKGVSNT